MLLEVQRDQRLDGGALLGVEVAAGDEVVGQGPGLVAGPGLEGGDELALVDQAVLQGEQAEEQVAVGGEAAMGRASGTHSEPGPRCGAVGPALSPRRVLTSNWHRPSRAHCRAPEEIVGIESRASAVRWAAGEGASLDKLLQKEMGRPGCLRRSVAVRSGGFAAAFLVSARVLGPLFGFLRTNFILVVPQADGVAATHGEELLHPVDEDAEEIPVISHAGLRPSGGRFTARS